MSYDFDLFVIGAGSGGVRASRLAAGMGARVAIAEESRVGGTCVIRGCVPKKFLVYASEFGHGFKDAKGYGWSADNVRFDWPTLIANKDQEIDRLNGIYQRLLDNSGIETFHDRAILKDTHTVHLVKENRDISADKILISVGGTPWIDKNVAGWELGITSNEALSLPSLPKRIVITGGGYIALEFACIFAGLGSDVTLVYRGPKVLRGFDEDIRDQLHKELATKGINVLTQTVFTKIEQVDGEKRVQLANGDTLVADEVMWAVGRRPATQSLGLNKAGVEVKPSGAVIVDDQHRTTQDNIFAIGDVTDRINLTPVAIREGIAFAQTQFNNNPTLMAYDNVPMAVFTQPPIGVVGLTEHEARDQFGEVDIYKTEFRPMKNILADSQERMLMKLVVDAKTDKVLGCHLIGEDVAEMIQMLAIPIKHGITKAEFDATCALHPTAAEEIVTLSKTT